MITLEKKASEPVPLVALPTTEAAEQTSLPQMKWPFNQATMLDPYMRIKMSYSENGPTMIFQTPPNSNSVLRSPVDGRIEAFEQPDKTSTVILLSQDHDLIILLEDVAEVFIRDEPRDPDSLTTVRAGEIIGNVGTFPDNSISLHVAHLARDPTSESSEWQVVDPRLLFRLP